MKGVKTITLVMLVMLISVPALAAGRLNVTQENYYTLKEGSYFYGYVFAKVENNGNKPIMINNALLEIFDVEGDAITSTDNFSSYARYLDPGDYTYLRMSTSIKDIDTVDVVDDYMLTISGKSSIDKKTIRLNCEYEYRENVQTSYRAYNYMFATITNNTEEILYQPCVTFALFDEDENILYLTGDNLDSNEALLPGSSILFRVSVDSAFVSYIEANNIVPTSMDAIAYAYVDND